MITIADISSFAEKYPKHTCMFFNISTDEEIKSIFHIKNIYINEKIRYFQFHRGFYYGYLNINQNLEFDKLLNNYYLNIKDDNNEQKVFNNEKYIYVGEAHFLKDYDNIICIRWHDENKNILHMSELVKYLKSNRIPIII